MTQEERLFDLIGNLPDDLTSQTDAPKKARRKITPRQRNRWIGIAVAACLVVAVGVWGMTATPPYLRFPKSDPDLGLPDQTTDTSVNTPQTNTPTQTERVKLNWPKSSGTSLADLRVTMLPLGERVAEYHQLENPRAIPKAYRPQYLGQPYNDMDGWYLPEDNHGLRYLVHQEEDGSYTLWEFACFEVLDEATLMEMESNLDNSIWSTIEWFSLQLNFTPYSYGEVLETIYGITSADDILSVTVNPSTMDNTDDGKKLQKEIGSFTVTDQSELDAFYAALSTSICYGSDHWELINLGETDPDGGLLNRVRSCRYLTVETTHGTIDTLKYSAAGGQFYEYSGIAYEPLDADTAAAMSEMFQIEYPE